MSNRTKYKVFVEVELNAPSVEFAKARVERALVCLENSLAYANGEVIVSDELAIEKVD